MPRQLIDPIVFQFCKDCAEWHKFTKSKGIVQGCKELAYKTMERERYAGRLKAPRRCEECRCIKKLYGHHYAGYARKHRLSLIYLCSKCHTKAHKIINRGGTGVDYLSPTPKMSRYYKGGVATQGRVGE